jgi:hypothetical protein
LWDRFHITPGALSSYWRDASPHDVNASRFGQGAALGVCLDRAIAVAVASTNSETPAHVHLAALPTEHDAQVKKLSKLVTKLGMQGCTAALAPSQRFHVIDRPVSYLCDPAPGGGALRRYAGYAIQPSQPAALTAGDLLAENVVDCEFRLIDSRLVSLRVAAGDPAGDTVTLYSQVQLVDEP